MGKQSIRKVKSPEDLKKYHNELLCLLAFPDKTRSHVAVMKTLTNLSRMAGNMTKKDKSILAETGIAGAWHSDSYSPDLFRIMSERGIDIDITWDDNESAGEAFDELLQECIFTAEGDAVMYEKTSTKDILKLLSKHKRESTLSWFLNEVFKLDMPSRLRDKLFSSLDLWAYWKLAKNGWSTTFLRFPKDGNKRTLLDVCRGTLAVRGRETDPVVYTTPALTRLVRGKYNVEVALFELIPERRLPLDTYVGYVAAKNGVPVSYGGAWILGHRAELGGNIFEEFRGKESKLLFTEIIKAYQKIYNAKIITVQPAQFGGDNTEALQSGAFWFYYSLGFRPDDRRLEALASKELEKRRRDPAYRSSVRTLKKLSTTQLVLNLGSKSDLNAKNLMSQKLGFWILSEITGRFKGNKDTARAHASKIWAALDAKNRSPFPEIGLLLLFLKDLGQWTQEEKRSLKKLLILKNGRSERDFVLAFQKHSRLCAYLTS